MRKSIKASVASLAIHCRRSCQMKKGLMCSQPFLRPQPDPRSWPIAERQELTSLVGFTTRLAGHASIIGWSQAMLCSNNGDGHFIAAFASSQGRKIPTSTARCRLSLECHNRHATERGDALVWLPWLWAAMRLRSCCPPLLCSPSSFQPGGTPSAFLTRGLVLLLCRKFFASRSRRAATAEVIVGSGTANINGVNSRLSL
jgi:hypothetical protein